MIYVFNGQQFEANDSKEVEQAIEKIMNHKVEILWYRDGKVGHILFPNDWRQHGTVTQVQS